MWDRPHTCKTLYYKRFVHLRVQLKFRLPLILNSVRIFPNRFLQLYILKKRTKEDLNTALAHVVPDIKTPI
jgi:hypothetical protein